MNSPQLTSEHDLQGRFVAGYVETHGMAHGLGTLLDVAERSRTDPGAEDVTFMLLGEGAEKPQLVLEAQSRGLGNALFLDSVPKADVARYWALLDVAIIHLRRTPLFETVIPSKLFEAMAMGIPLAYGVRGESARIVEEEGAGLCFEPEDAKGLYDCRVRLRSDAALRKNLSNREAAAAEEYDRAHLARRMPALLEGHQPSRP